MPIRLAVPLPGPFVWIPNFRGSASVFLNVLFCPIIVMACMLYIAIVILALSLNLGVWVFRTLRR
jgi:hypothetical protein